MWPAPTLLLFLPGAVWLLPRVVRLAVLCPSGKKKFMPKGVQGVQAVQAVQAVRTAVSKCKRSHSFVLLCSFQVHVRVGGFALLVLLFVMFVCWVAMGVQLMSLLECVQKDGDASCFKIAQIHVADMTTAAFRINVHAQLDNPGQSAWLSVGAVTSKVVAIEFASVRKHVH